jgi:hypothetical protein
LPIDLKAPVKNVQVWFCCQVFDPNYLFYLKVRYITNEIPYFYMTPSKVLTGRRKANKHLLLQTGKPLFLGGKEVHERSTGQGKVLVRNSRTGLAERRQLETRRVRQSDRREHSMIVVHKFTTGEIRAPKDIRMELNATASIYPGLTNERRRIEYSKDGPRYIEKRVMPRRRIPKGGTRKRKIK